jgi:hypothetical protein
MIPAETGWRATPSVRVQPAASCAAMRSSATLTAGPPARRLVEADSPLATYLNDS